VGVHFILYRHDYLVHTTVPPPSACSAVQGTEWATCTAGVRPPVWAHTCLHHHLHRWSTGILPLPCTTWVPVLYHHFHVPPAFPTTTTAISAPTTTAVLPAILPACLRGRIRELYHHWSTGGLTCHAATAISCLPGRHSVLLYWAFCISTTTTCISAPAQANRRQEGHPLPATAATCYCILNIPNYVLHVPTSPPPTSLQSLHFYLGFLPSVVGYTPFYTTTWAGAPGMPVLRWCIQALLGSTCCSVLPFRVLPFWVMPPFPAGLLRGVCPYHSVLFWGLLPPPAAPAATCLGGSGRSHCTYLHPGRF